MNSSLASSSARLLRPSCSSSYATRSLATASSSSTSSTPPPPRKKRPSRTLSSQPGADLVGPPDAVSNLRPVIYGSAFDAVSEEAESSSASGQRRAQAQQQQRQASSQYHPYSTSEFTTPATTAAAAALPLTSSSSSSTSKRPPSPYYLSLLSRLESAELTHHLLRSRADGFSQRFWADNNQRYAAALSAYRSLHPSKSAGGGGGKDDDESVLLAPFYSAWLDANSKRYAAYNQRLWRMTRADLGPAMRYEGLKVWVRVVAWWERRRPW